MLVEDIAQVVLEQGQTELEVLVHRAMGLFDTAVELKQENHLRDKLISILSTCHNAIKEYESTRDLIRKGYLKRILSRECYNHLKKEIKKGNNRYVMSRLSISLLPHESLLYKLA